MATRRVNKDKQARGEPVTRGYAAKAKQKAAAKVALADKLAAEVAAAQAVTAAPVAVTPPDIDGDPERG